MKKLVFLTALSLMVSIGTTAHAKTCEEKLKSAINKGIVADYHECERYGRENCRSTGQGEISRLCMQFGFTPHLEQRQLRWSDVDTVAIERKQTNGKQRVLEKIRVRAETSKVRNNRTYY